MRKVLVCCLSVLLAVCLLCGCSELGIEIPDVSVESAVLDTVKSYPVEGAVNQLQIQINAANLTIRRAETFCVESNLKFLNVTEDTGVLKIVEDTKLAVTSTDAMLTICIPSGTVFESVEIKAGAGKVKSDVLESQRVKLELGAGDAQFAALYAMERAEISGGAGKITVTSGTLRDLELDMGIGALELTAALPGNSELSCGMGTARVTLLGSKADYSLDVEKGLGVVTVDGETVSGSLRTGSGPNRVDIEGGVGTVKVDFES